MKKRTKQELRDEIESLKRALEQGHNAWLVVLEEVAILFVRVRSLRKALREISKIEDASLSEDDAKYIRENATHSSLAKAARTPAFIAKEALREDSRRNREGSTK